MANSYESIIPSTAPKLFFGSLMTMNCDIECKQFDIKHEEDPLSISEIKIEPQDIKSEIKTEAEEGQETDVNYEMQSTDNVSTYALTEVKNTEKDVGICQKQEKELRELHTRTKEEKSGINPNVCEAEAIDICETYLEEEKCNINMFNYSGLSSVCKDTSACKKSLFKNNSCIERTEKLFICNVCSKSFSHKHDLIVHIGNHARRKNFSCNSCSKSFSKLWFLTRHMRYHTGQKPYNCDVCAKSFYDKLSLVVHTRTHSGERPFKCNFCSKSFNNKSNLITHVRIHTCEKPFTCKICNKSFSHSCDLTRHIRSHTGEKPFTCDMCFKSFANKSTLTVHLRKHTGEKPFPCNLCNKSFSDKRNLVMHNKRNHI